MITTFLRACPTLWQENSWHRHVMKKLRYCYPMYNNAMLLLQNHLNSAVAMHYSSIYLLKNVRIHILTSQSNYSEQDSKGP